MNQQNARMRWRIVISVATLAIALLAMAAALQLYAYQKMADAARGAAAIGELQSEIMRADESITMAARMTVETGDPSWRRRHEEHAAALGGQLQRLEEALPARPEVEARLDDINRALIALERKAMADGATKAEARAILDSAEYARHKAAYLDSARAIVRVHQVSVESRRRLGLAAISYSALMTLLSLAILAALSVYLVRRFKRLRSQLEAQNADLDRRVAERTAELEAVSRRFALAQKARSVGVWEYDIAGERLEWDETCRALHGVPEEDYAGRLADWAGALHPEDRDAVRARFSNAINGGARECRDVYRVLRRDGETRWLRGDAVILRDERGEPHKVVGVNIDITQSVRAERELKDAKVAAEAANAAKSLFIATMSHELRTPLNGILGAAQILEMHGPAPAQTEWIAMIKNCCDELQRLVGEILDLSRIETGELGVVEKTFHLSDVIAETLMQFNAVRRNKGLVIDSDIAPELPPELTGDPDRLRQVLINLVGNAVKFTEKGKVSVIARRSGDTLEIDVADTGVGIPADDLPRIFDRFYQVESGLSRRFDGAGLGLSIVKELVALMGGAITVESRLGAGSTFRVALPLRKPKDGAARAVEAAPEILASSPRGVKVLLAEDNRDSQAVTKTFLTSAGYEVAIAHDGLETLAALERERFEVLLLDIQMPNLDGRGVLTRLKDEPRLKRGVAVIVVTANALAEVGRELIELGADAFLSTWRASPKKSVS